MLHTLRFGSVSELLSYLDKTPVHPPNFYSGHNSSGERGYNGWGSANDPTWDYGVGLAKAHELARRGWTEGAERIALMVEPVVRKIASRIYRPEPVFDIEGSAIDMSRFLEGDPECFVQWRESDIEDRSRSGGIVHIVANVSASLGFTAQEFYEKGAAVGILIDCLETAGKRVILDVVAAGIEPRKQDDDPTAVRSETIVRVKEAREPLNPEMLAYTVAHPAFYRRLLFQARATIPITIPRPGHTPTEASIQGDVTIGASKLWETGSPVEWAIAELKKQGVEFRE